MEKRLTPRQERFVTGVLSGLSDATAARQAGYGEHYARKAAMWIRSIPRVKRAIEKEQAQLRERAKYDVEQAVVEINKAVEFGYRQRNPKSIAKLLELKSKLYGLLVDRVEMVTVDLSGALARAEARVINVTPLHRNDSLPASALLTAVAGPAMGESVGRVPGVKGNLFGD
jgi:phage terminase small subunit